MSGRTYHHADRQQAHRRRDRLPELRALELQALEILIASGESLGELLEYWARWLTAQHLTNE